MQRILIFIFLISLFGSCANEVKKETAIAPPAIATIPTLEVPAQTIEKSKLNYDNKVSLWTLEGKKFSGYAVSYFQDSTLLQKFGILNGKKQNESMDWYADGHLKNSANYHQGKLHGEKKFWTSDTTHTLVSHLNYHLGKLNGVQKKWYVTGEIFKILNLAMGKEEGMQQAFRKNGDLFANYEARKGRTFGLKKAALCFGLEDENIKREK